MEFAALEIAEVVSARKSLKSAAKSVGRQTLKKPLRSGNQQKSLIATKVTKQASRSRSDIFTNISR